VNRAHTNNRKWKKGEEKTGQNKNREIRTEKIEKKKKKRRSENQKSRSRRQSSQKKRREERTEGEEGGKRNLPEEQKSKAVVACSREADVWKKCA